MAETEEENIATPVVRDRDVLVRVAVSGVNPGDWDVLHGTPYVLRPMIGLHRPRNPILGLAVTGVVESVGDTAIRRTRRTRPERGEVFTAWYYIPEHLVDSAPMHATTAGPSRHANRL